MRKKVDSFRLELKRKTTNDCNEWKDLKKKIRIRRINHYRISKPDREGVTGYGGQEQSG
jgi:hypothetical protein